MNCCVQLEATQLHCAEGDAPSAGDGQAVALVVDAEVTSYLMMGALSPGLKRHSVTLFEGGPRGCAGGSSITPLL